tara:strand:- start:1288 stop:1713 length:426 start_codon:yes stop_codon:yes gene_type:complete
MTELSLRVTRTINAPIEAVFNAWLDPAMLVRFMTPGEGVTVPKAETDARVGGRFDIVMTAGEKELPHSGTYLTIDRHSKLVFTWESPYSDAGSTVTLNLAPSAAGGTDVELLHVKFPSEESRNNHEAGWGAILATLDGVLA